MSGVLPTDRRPTLVAGPATSGPAPASPAGTGIAMAAAALYFGAMYLAYPYREVFAFDPDEGIQAGKALLLERGCALYAQMWNDQPPLFTHLLRAWLDLFGWTVADGRTLVLIFGAALVFAVYDIVRLEAGHLAAAAAVIALAASTYVPRLSVSIMIGLPSVTLATLALWALFRWLHSRRDVWLVVSGALLGCSLATKLFTIFLLPVIAVWLVALTPARGRARWWPAAVWLTAALGVGAALLLALVGPDQLNQLAAAHLAGRHTPALQRFGAGGLLLTGLAEWPLTLLGAAAFAWLLWQRRGRMLVFPAWAAAAAAVLLTHAPVWYHHQVLLTVPYCPAIGVALADLLRGPPRIHRAAAARWRAAAAIVLAALFASAARHVLLAPRADRDDTAAAAVEALRRHLGPRRVVVATDLMYAFRAGATVPPRLADLSLKRLETDAQIGDEIDASFTSDAPEEVIVGANPPARVAEAVTRGMSDRYQPVFAAPGTAGVTVFVRRDLIDAPPADPRRDADSR